MIVNGPIGPNMESVPNLVKEELKSGNEEKESNLKMGGNLVLEKQLSLKIAILNHVQIQVCIK